jgi:DNA polymerase
MTTLASLDRETIETALRGNDLSPRARRALELRLAGAQAAIKKIDALLARAGAGDRVRGAFRYHGAATGRFSSEGAQAQNMKRPQIKDIDAAISAIATGDYAHLKALYRQPLAVLGDCGRAMISAADLYRLMGGDLSSIEGRLIAWVANEEWKLNAYRWFDATQDPRDEPYCIAACKVFRVPDGTFDKSSPERKVGKTCELAFGYQGGLGAWRKFEPDHFTDPEVERFKTEWRAAHPKIVQFWREIDAAAVTAVIARNNLVRCGRINLICDDTFLRIFLPSGRAIHYPFPRLIKDAYGRSRVVFMDNADGQFTECRGGQGAYGGLWTENIISGIARDLLAQALVRIDAVGYPIVLHVHDEIVVEMPIGHGRLEDFLKLMTQNPPWADGLPIAAEGWSGPRYRK